MGSGQVTDKEQSAGTARRVPGSPGPGGAILRKGDDPCPGEPQFVGRLSTLDLEPHNSRFPTD